MNMYGWDTSDFQMLSDPRIAANPLALRRGLAQRLERRIERQPDRIPGKRFTVELNDWERDFGRATVQLDSSFDPLVYLRTNFETIGAMAAEVIYRSPRRIDRYLSINRSLSWGDTQGFWTVFDQAADADFLSDYMSQAPPVGVHQREIPFVVFPYGNNIVGANYSLAAIERTADGTAALNARSLQYAIIAALRLREETVLQGNGIFGRDYQLGMLNQKTSPNKSVLEDPNTGETLIYEVSLAKNLNGQFGGTNEYADPEALILDFQKMLSTIVTMTHGEFANDMSTSMVLIMPTMQADVLMNAKLTYGNMPVWEYLRQYNAWTRRGNPPLDIVELDYDFLDTAATGNKPRGVINMINPEFAEVHEVQEPMPGMPRSNGDAYEIPCRAAMGPYILKQPASMIYLNLMPH